MIRTILPRAIAVAIAAIVWPGIAVSQWSLDTDIPFDPDTQVGRLDNGIRYFIRENHEPRNRAELRLAVGVGSTAEMDEQRGLAHFVEHMGFNGTRHFGPKELVDYLESIGMRFGADVNAYTSFDETVYMLTVPTDDPELLETGFQVLEDWAFEQSFVPEEIEKERGVVIEEWRLGQGARQRINDKQFPLIFKGSRYAERLPIGKKEILESFQHETLVEFYRDWYRPELMAIVAVGDFETARIEALIQKYFGPVPASTEPLERPQFQVPPHENTVISVETDPELATSNVTVMTQFPKRPAKNIAAYRRGLVESMFTGMLNTRFRERLQAEDPPFIYGYASIRPSLRPLESFSLTASVKGTDVERALRTLLMEMKRVEEHGFTPGELERRKKAYLSGIESAYQERDKLPSDQLASTRVSHFLYGSPAAGMEFVYEASKHLVPGIELSEVNQVAELFSQGEKIVLVSGPTKTDEPFTTEDSLREVLRQIDALEVEPYVDETSDEPLVASLPDPGKIVEKDFEAQSQIHTWELSNGVRVYLKPTDFKNDQIVFQAWSPGGMSLARDDIFASARVSAQVAQQCGLGHFNVVELQKKLAGKQVSAWPFLSYLSEGMRGETRPQDLETLLQLIYLHFQEPRHDETAFSSLMSRWKSFFENNQADPNRVYQDSLMTVLSQNHPRRQPFSAEVLDEVELEEALSFFGERFGDASDFSFAFAGNLDTEDFAALCERYLATLPALNREEQWRDEGVNTPPGIVKRTFEKGVDPKSRTTIVFSGEAEWSRQNRYTMSSLAEAMRIRMREVLREDLGGVYGVGVSGWITRWPTSRYQVRVSFGCDPERLDELTDEVIKLVEEIRANGVSEEIIDKIQEIQRREYEESLRQNDFWVSQIQYRDDNDLPLDSILDYEEFVDALSGEALKMAAKKYLNQDRVVQLSMLPEDTSIAEE